MSLGRAMRLRVLILKATPRSRAASMPPQEGGEQEAGEGADRGGEKSVDIGEDRGLLRDGGCEQARRALRGSGDVARMRAEGVAIGREPVGRLAAETVDMQADEVGVDLFAHSHEGLHEGGADLAAEQAAGLEQACRS